MGGYRTSNWRGTCSATRLKYRDCDVNRHRNQHGIEKERDHRMKEYGTAHSRGLDHDVRYLGSHADDEGKVEEVPGAGPVRFRKLQRLNLFWGGVIQGEIVQVCIVEGGNRVKR